MWLMETLLELTDTRAKKNIQLGGQRRLGMLGSNCGSELQDSSLSLKHTQYIEVNDAY